MKNKIFNYDFLIIGAGMIGSLTAIALTKKKYKVLIVEKQNSLNDDKRTLAVNANSRDFLRELGLWNKLANEKEPIKKIIIKDSINKEDLIFQNSEESMGTVIYNKSLLKAARKYLDDRKLIMTGIELDIQKIKSSSPVKIKKKTFYFKKIIISLGKHFSDIERIKKINFRSKHHAYVGFFNHQLNHNQVAYEIFTPKGPLAVLPSPNKTKNKSTFIYSTQDKLNLNDLSNLIKTNFNNTHGNIKLINSINFFPISPHLSESKKKDILILGDTAHSIHPVAGQGWNLGIKDIQELLTLLDNLNIDHPDFDKNFSSKRIIENFSYLSFTSLINYLYENEHPITKSIVRLSFTIFNRIPRLKQLFIKQAMGKLI